MTDIQLERGDDICAECGAHIRNIVRIDGTPYGTTCAEAYLPRHERNRVRKTDFSQVAREALKARRTELLREAHVDLPPAFVNKPSHVLVAHVWGNENHPHRAKLAMIVEAREIEKELLKTL